MLRMYVSGLYGNWVLEMVPISFFVIWTIEEVHVCKVQVVAVLKKQVVFQPQLLRLIVWKDRCMSALLLESPLL